MPEKRDSIGINCKMNTASGCIEYILKRSNRRRTTAICIDPQGLVKVFAPENVYDKSIADFINKKADWIIKHIRIRKAFKKQSIFTGSFEGKEPLFLGRKYPLNIERTQKKRGKLDFDGKVFNIALPAADDHNEEAAAFRDLFINWYRKQASEIFGGRVFHYSRIMKAEPQQISIRTQKRLWGSCDSRKKAINLNWQLIMAPLEVIDYVVVHELSHFFHPNHSKRFWSKVEQYMPNYKEHKQWLKKNAAEMLIG